MKEGCEKKLKPLTSGNLSNSSSGLLNLWEVTKRQEVEEKEGEKGRSGEWEKGRRGDEKALSFQ
jgi:hypothetical protein